MELDDRFRGVACSSDPNHSDFQFPIAIPCFSWNQKRLEYHKNNRQSFSCRVLVTSLACFDRIYDFCSTFSCNIYHFSGSIHLLQAKYIKPSFCFEHNGKISLVLNLSPRFLVLRLQSVIWLKSFRRSPAYIFIYIHIYLLSGYFSQTRPIYHIF